MSRIIRLMEKGMNRRKERIKTHKDVDDYIKKLRDGLRKGNLKPDMF